MERIVVLEIERLLWFPFLIFRERRRWDLIRGNFVITVIWLIISRNWIFRIFRYLSRVKSYFPFWKFEMLEGRKRANFPRIPHVKKCPVRSTFHRMNLVEAWNKLFAYFSIPLDHEEINRATAAADHSLSFTLRSLYSYQGVT